MSLFQRVSECFVQAQRSSATHAKMVQKLKQIYVNNDPGFETYMTCIIKCIHVSFKQDYKLPNPFVDRCIAFVSAFCVSMYDHHQKNVDADTDSPIVVNLVTYLIEATNERQDSHRYRASQYICKIFNDLIGFDITEEFCHRVQDGLIGLMDDKISKIRMEAGAALAPLQDMANAHCPIISVYIHHLEYDPSASVRRICAEKVALKREIIPHLLGASRDVDSKVRMAVFKRTAKYPSKFKIVQKQELIDTGSKDSEKVVKSFITTVLIPAWLLHYELDYIKLICALRLDSTWEDLNVTTAVCEFTLSSLFNLRPIEEYTSVLKLNEKKLLDFEDFNYDTALFWRLLLKFLRAKHDLDIFDYAPQLPDLCQYITQFCIQHQSNTISGEDFNYASLEFKYKLLQLFYMTMEYDFVDIACKTIMLELIKTVLAGCQLDLEVVNVIICNLNIVMPDNQKQAMFICDITGDLMYNGEEGASQRLSAANLTPNQSQPEPPPKPTEVALQTEVLNSTQEEYAIAQLKTRYFMLEAELDQAVKDQDYIKASELKPELDILQNQLDNLRKANEMIPEEPAQEEEPEETEAEDGTVRVTPKNPVLLKKALTVMAGFLTSSNINVLNSVVQTFKMNVIDELIHSTNIAVKIMAMKCLALCCTIDMHTAKMAIPTCYAIVMMHNRTAHNPPPAELVIICVGAMVDPLILFGTKILAHQVESSCNDSVAVSEGENEVFSGGASLSGIIREILEMFNDDNIKIQETAVKSICNFILTARIYSHGIISRLMVKYVLPISSEPESNRIQQIIGVTLGKLSLVSGSAEHLGKAIIPTMKIILKAPPNSPLSEVDVNHVGKLMLDICGQYPNAQEIYVYVCKALLKEIREKPNSSNNLSYTKMLLLLRLSKNDTDEFANIIETLDDLRNILYDTKVISNIIKFNTALTLQQNSMVDGATNGNVDDSENERNTQDSDSD